MQPRICRHIPAQPDSAWLTATTPLGLPACPRAAPTPRARQAIYFRDAADLLRGLRGVCGDGEARVLLTVR